MTRLASLEHRIEAAYQDLGYELGWRFLYTAPSTFATDAALVFVGMNPGGRADVPDLRGTVESGNAFLCETWGKNGRPKPHQVQVRRLFEALAASRGTDRDALMAETLTANFCPFRSPDWERLDNEEDAVEFSTDLWSRVLDHVRPAVVIADGKKTGNWLADALQRQGAHSKADREKHPVPCYKRRRDTFELSRYESPWGWTLMVHLPHLTRCRIFGREGEPLFEQPWDIEQFTSTITTAMDRDGPRASLE